MFAFWEFTFPWKETVKNQVKCLVSQMMLSVREEKLKQVKEYRDTEWLGRLKF